MTGGGEWAQHDAGCTKCCRECIGGACPKHCGSRRTKAGGHLCKREKGWGTKHEGIGRCKLHGGNTPNHQRAAEHEQARQAVAVLGLPVETTPEQALADEVKRSAGHITWAFAQLAALQGAEELFSDGKPSPLLALYQWERQHGARVAKAAIDAGLAEREVKLAEAQGEQIGNVLSQVVEGLFSALTEAGIDVEVLVRLRREKVPEVVRAALVPLVGGAA